MTPLAPAAGREWAITVRWPKDGKTEWRGLTATEALEKLQMTLARYGYRIEHIDLWPQRPSEEPMPMPAENPKIAAALNARRELIRQLEAISPNSEWLDREPGLEDRLAAVFRELARQAMAAAAALTADES